MRSDLASTKPENTRAAVDERPRFAIGHINLGVRDVERAMSFYTEIGMRPVVNMGQVAILELRGGTHIIIHESGEAPGSLDLIVDDIDDTRDLLEAAGADPSTIRRGNPHDRFTATDPEGNKLTVNSNHAIGPV